MKLGGAYVNWLKICALLNAGIDPVLIYGAITNEKLNRVYIGVLSMIN